MSQVKTVGSIIVAGQTPTRLASTSTAAVAALKTSTGITPTSTAAIEAVKLLTTFNPSEQARFCKHPERCVTGTAPTLAQVRKRLNEDTARAFLIAQLNDYNNFVGVSEGKKMRPEQLQALADMILNEYYYLKLSEFALFFYRLKGGQYGIMYGTVDPTRIMCGLKQFIREERNTILDKVAREEEERKRVEGLKGAISRDEWERMKAERAKALQKQADAGTKPPTTDAK